MMRARAPATTQQRRPAAPAVTAYPRKKGEGRPKRSRSPCEDELKYKALETRKQAVQQRLRQQLEVLSGLEANILDFYYTHTIRYEPLLENQKTTSSERSARVDSVSEANGKNGTFTSGLVSLFPELQDQPPSSRTEAVDAPTSAAAAAPLAVPSKTRYYYDSTLMRLYREAAVQERDLATAYTAEEARVTAAERQIQTDIIDGALAKQLATEQEHQATLRQLKGTLAQLQADCSNHVTSIQEMERQLEATESAMDACEKRKVVLEAKKREQMDNAEKIKDEVAAFRRTVESALQDVEKRNRINKDLEDEIARRRALLRRRRKE